MELGLYVLVLVTNVLLEIDGSIRSNNGLMFNRPVQSSLSCQRFEQQSGVDYTKTFSLVIKASTFHIILALAMHFDWPIKQLDVSNAFLHGTLMDEVYMEQPQGFFDATKPDFVCKLHKSIYGVKQHPHTWFTCLSTALLELGFTTSLVDSSLFLFFHGDITIFMLVYVDDIIVTALCHSVPYSSAAATVFFEGLR